MARKYTSHRTGDFEFIVLTPAGMPDANLAVAGSRAGALGILNLEFAPPGAEPAAELSRLSDLRGGRWGVLVSDAEQLRAVVTAAPDRLETVVLSNRLRDGIDALVRLVKAENLHAYAIATNVDEARAAEAAGADAVIAKGHESGGWVGEEGSFILLQRLLGELSGPVFAAGGIGLHTVAAAYVAGAAGAVLDGQLLLARESPLPAAVKERIASMDGSETAVLGSSLGLGLRVYSRPDLQGVRELAELELEAAPEAWRSAASSRVGWASCESSVLTIGQDAAFAVDLAKRFETVGGIVAGLREAIADGCAGASLENPLAEGAPLAVSHDTRYPIAQGPMTRVSDRAEFAAAVAEAGALPFLALALMRAPEVEVLLAQTGDLLGNRPWGVGILGFVPQELRTEQLGVIRDHRPPYALIAGGRPDQARALEDEGIATYLHVPSPGLLRLYLAGGARRFVFEGRECGGHVGPRSSFVLWDTMIRVLVEDLPAEGSDCHVLFAGGIHDALSAAMVAATAAAATRHGIRVGALMGTAYLFTPEATGSGAITPRFQEAALAGRDTVLLESGPGHATRCLPSPYVGQFEAEKRRLTEAGVSGDELRGRLEQLNVGRLRIASKGAERDSRSGSSADAPKLTTVDSAGQWERGMYMIGQAAALRDESLSLADLHRDVARGSTDLLSAVPVPETAEAPAPPAADVAIIGLGCILPGAHDVATFWSNILGKVDAIGEVPEHRWDWRRYYDPDPAAKDRVYSRWGGFVDDVPFDPIAFGLPPNSLSSIEPFQLMALLTAQAALRDAGYDSRPFARERTSVILGAGGGGADLAVGYTVRSALPSLFADASPEVYDRLPEWTEDTFPGLLMNVAAGRIANRLDLGGANYTVDAACASSLTAVSLGTRELQAATSDMVLAGGIDAIQNPFAYLCFSKTHALSPKGRCRPFDASADGIAISEGFATIVLKRLADAERDGDRIYGVIRGVGAASDGRDRSLTAPRPEGQMRALRRAYAQARISPASVELVEAHGTGTVAGDGAEVQALTRVFGDEREDEQWCAIGSVKSMIGHTKATAGVAGLVKAALALHHRVLPPTIGVTKPNPKASFERSPFYVNTEARPWLQSPAGHPRRAGISAFGFGGTDFHVVLEEYTGDPLGERAGALDRWPAELLLWRGSRQDIAAAVESLTASLAAGAAPSLADLAFTVGRDAAPPGDGRETLAVVADSLEDLRAKLGAARDALAPGHTRVHAAGVHWSSSPLATHGRVAFLFPGQGSQEVDMGRELALAFPEALDCFERADRMLADRLPRQLTRYIFPPPSFGPEEAKRRQAELTETDVAQSALGATDLAHLHVLRALGVEPQMTAGHSYGELVALCAAGSLAEDDLLLLSEARGRFMREASAGEAGAMAAVDAAPERLRSLLDEGQVVAANLNAPEQTVLSGPTERVEEAIAWCDEREIRARLLPVACAFHSPHVAAAQRRLAEELERTELVAPQLPVFSNTTGARHADDPAAIRAVLAEHLIRPVQFVREVEAMYTDGARVFVEAGPRPVLTGLVGRIIGEKEHLAVAAHRPGGSALTQFLHCLAALAAEGVPLNLERLFRGRSARRVDLTQDASGEEARSGVWLVDGGGARPAGVARPPAASPATQPDKEPLVTRTTTNGGSPPVHAVVPPAEPLPAVSGDRVSDVMARYQAVMQRFLETQRAVMLTYLGAPRASVDASPATLPLPQPALLAAPVEAQPPPAEGQPPPAEAQPPSAGAQPPPQPTPEATSVPAGNGHGVATPEEIEQRLLTIVSERTGYPQEMLGLDADLEADLGIDSIKRVEIAGTLTQSVALPEGAVDVEELTASRTLRQVIAVLGAAIDAPREDRPFEPGPAGTERTGRFVLQAASAPAITATDQFAGQGAVVIVDDETGVGEALAVALERRGDRPVRVGRADWPADADAAAGLAAAIHQDEGGVKALVHIGALGAPVGDAGLPALLMLVQALRGDLEAAGAAGGSAVLGATRLGGSFGVDDASEDGDAAQGAIPGFLKTLAQEWPAVRVKAIDLSSREPDVVAGQLLDELVAADGLVEVGYRGERTQPALAPAPLDDRIEEAPLDAESVLLVTGGARGITAEVSLSLARRHRPTLVLVGRTAAGVDEEEADTAGVTELPDLRAAFIERRRRERAEVTPALVEDDCRRLLRAREVRGNLARLRATGARVEYVICDVRDADAFGAVIDGIYERYGRIDGAIHGAGVIEDRLVRDKTLDSLERVMATKAGAARTLAERLRPEGLRFLVLFSSVSGRFGNRGQADYAAASEVLNKLAQELDRRWPARVVSIGWGPWRTTGMVSPEVERQFASRGIASIPVELGCRALEDELRRGRKGEAEVVVTVSTSEPPPLLAGATELTRTAAGGLVALRRLRVDHDRYLDHHRVDGRPVLPFAAAMELMAEAAAEANPGAEVAALRDIRVLQGITVDEREGTEVRIEASPVSSDGNAQVTIGAPEGGRGHYRALVAIRRQGRRDGTVTPGPEPLPGLPPFAMSIDDAYRDLLFHGPLFQRIAAIEGMDERGAVSLLRPSDPRACLTAGEVSDWLLDPVLLDCALQLQVVWARLNWDVTLLPAEIGAHVRSLPRASAGLSEADLVRHELRVRHGSEPPLCRADHWFYLSDGRLLGTLEDVVGVGTPALNRLAGVGA